MTKNTSDDQRPRTPPLPAPRTHRSIRTPRMFDWLIAALLLAVLVWCIAPQQLPVSVYKLSLVALAAVAGYWIDRSLFPYARPDAFLMLEPFASGPEVDAKDDLEVGSIELDVTLNATLYAFAAVCMLRRAIIVAATMLAVGLGA